LAQPIVDSPGAPERTPLKLARAPPISRLSSAVSARALLLFNVSYSDPLFLPTEVRALMDTVLRNERTLRRFQDIELALIGAAGLAAFIDALFARFPAEFSLDAVRVWLDRAQPLAAEIVDDAPHPDVTADLPLGAWLMRLTAGGVPWLGAPGAWAGAAFGPAGPARVASAIVLPLRLGDDRAARTIGCLCLGSADPERFAPGMATDLLERFARIVAASLDNVAHRERLQRLGITDALTGLANRRYFDERLREAVLGAARRQETIACLFFDIDRFKQINDVHGHAVGDRVLVAVAHCARSQLRAGDTLVRYGGEEFAVLLLRTARNEATVVAERVRHAVAALELDVSDTHPMALRVTVSIGVSVRTIEEPVDAAGAVARLLDAADAAMYRAKRNGRDRVEFA
jgi:diguanylate cyclase (GGDEF)-like protein